MHDLRLIANAYLTAHNLPTFGCRPARIKVNPERARRIAAAYAQLPSGGPSDYASHLSYQHFRLEVRKQFEWCYRCGFLFVPYGKGEEPYRSSADMIHSVRGTLGLHVYADDADHPFLDPDDQFRFRAIHDVFGHAMFGNSFGPNGEENAWHHHVQMFSYDARSAMTAETRGQNSWVNFGPFSDRPAKDRPYAEQKATCLPQWCERF